MSYNYACCGKPAEYEPNGDMLIHSDCVGITHGCAFVTDEYGIIHDTADLNLNPSIINDYGDMSQTW